MQGSPVPENVLSQNLIPLLNSLGLSTEWHSLLYHAIAFIGIFSLAFIGFLITSRFLNTKVTKLVVKTKTHLDDALHQHGFFSRLAHLVPAIFIGAANNTLYDAQSSAAYLLDLIATLYLIFAATSILNALLNAIHTNYNHTRYAKRIPIDGFIQVGKLIVVALAVLLVAAKVLDKSPTLLLSGLGAVTAILLLVFKDTILGFVAGINIVANRTVNNGDWVEIPSYGADGTVLALGLTTVKVQNWDNTITTIPTYALMNEEVKNWRGMEESGGRRIKRTILINAHGIKLCSDQLQTALKDANLYCNSPYPDMLHHSESSNDVTNIGLLRHYIHHYLAKHPLVNAKLTLLVRQLPASDSGIPIEMYCFSKEKSWAKYETLQAEIVEHILAVLPLFELKVFQSISDQVEVSQRQHN